MIFSKKTKTLQYSVEICTKCKNMLKRRYAKGDILFASASKCKCGNIMQIAMIFGEEHQL